MTDMMLGVFTQEFLEAQGLDGCSITFEPYHAKVSRRAKRSNAKIAVKKDPKTVPRLANKLTVHDLTERLLSLSEDLMAWTESPGRRYRPTLFDASGDLVKVEALLGELRGRAAARQQYGMDRARRLLTKALNECDRLLESSEVNKLIVAMLNERQ